MTPNPASNTLKSIGIASGKRIDLAPLCLTLIAALMAVLSTAARSQDVDVMGDRQQGVSLFGEPLLAPAQISPGVAENLEKAKAAYEANPHSADAIIWYGRRIAYTGDYQKAIAIFSEGIRKHPGDSRLYRHRGHRYISLRRFEDAISDLSRAAKLIEGKTNAIEPDGAPNARNIPVSTRQGNIWYHLGLAYYLKHDFEQALWAYKNARDTSDHPDNLVSSTHWIYMILRRLGREAEARQALKPIDEKLDVIENFAYFNLCLMYQNPERVETLQHSLADSPQDAATQYGLANWYFYNGERQRGLALMQGFIDNSDAWPAFGYIAAEADLAAAR